MFQRKSISLAETAGIVEKAFDPFCSPTLTQTYDGLGNLASLNANVASSDLFTNNYSYDTLGQMTQVTQSGSGVSDKGASFAYNPLGRFTTVATFASITTSDPIASSAYGYDDANQLTSLTHTKSSDSSTIAAYGFTYDANGQLTAETSPDGSIAYTYDHGGRLTGASGTALPASQDYAYDSNNNRISTTVGSTTNSSLATGGNNQIATDGTYDYAYDPDGNLITKTTISTGATENFAWDYRNRLTDITYKNSEGTTTQHIHYTYDVFNRRITQEIDSTGSGTYDQVEHYVYDPAGNLLMTLNGSGAVTHVFLNGPASNQVLADDAGSGNVTWMLADQQGSVRDVLDSTGTPIDHIETDPYGNILTQSSPSDQPRFLYAGMQLDTTGLYFDNARYYDPTTGSFISTDPSGFAGGSGNLYGYVNADPTNLVDPNGLVSQMVGWIYTVRWIDSAGNARIYTGQAVQSTPLVRIAQTGHKAQSTLADPTAEITAKPVFADLQPGLSNRGTLNNAAFEARLAAEYSEMAINGMPGSPGVANVASIKAESAEQWADDQDVELGLEFRFKSATTVPYGRPGSIPPDETPPIDGSAGLQSAEIAASADGAVGAEIAGVAEEFGGPLAIASTGYELYAISELPASEQLPALNLALGGLNGALYGAEIGAEIGSIGGPLGALAGGIIGAIVGGHVGSSAASWVNNGGGDQASGSSSRLK